MKNDKKNILDRFISRRQFLVGSGVTLALPSLLSMMPKAQAQSVAAEKKLRLVLLGCPYGMYRNHMNPEPEALTGKLQSVNTLNGVSFPNVKYAPLSSLASPISYVVDSSFNDLKGDMNIIKGLDQMQTGGHPKGFFAGSASNEGSGGGLLVSGRSIDVVISESAAFRASYKGSNPIVRVSNYGSSNSNDFFFDRNKNASSFAQGFENTIRFYPTTNDKTLFQSLFSGLSTTSTPTTVVDRRKFLIDLVKPDLDLLRQSKRLSTADKQILQQFSEGIFQVENNLIAPTTTMTCSLPGQPTFQAPTGKAPANFDLYWKNISEMMILAFKCDISRMLCSELSYEFLSNYADAHHAIDGASEYYYGSKMQKDWIVSLSKHLVRGLKTNLDANGETLLQNSLVVWHNEHAERAHLSNNIPVLTFGQLGGKVRSGYYMDFQQKSDASLKDEEMNRGYPAKMMMISIMQALGVSSTEYLKEGDGSGFGIWPSSISGFYSSYFAANHNKPLPFFTL